jgi:YHS domain-containing protein
MKQLAIYSIALFFLASCGNATNEQPAAATDNHEQHDHQGHDHNHDAPIAANAIIDPVCGMVKDSTWTDYTLYKGDTVWFCAAPEKVAFEANPEKYAPNIKH